MQTCVFRVCEREREYTVHTVGVIVGYYTYSRPTGAILISAGTVTRRNVVHTYLLQISHQIREAGHAYANTHVIAGCTVHVSLSATQGLVPFFCTSTAGI